MEREKGQDLALDEISRAIIERLLFPESLNALLDEVSADNRIVKAVLRELAADELVLVQALTSTGEWTPTRIFDADQLDQYRFTASAKGLKKAGLV